MSQARAPKEPYERALERAGRLLAVRPRTRHEVRQRLRAAGFEDGVVNGVVTRLGELCLLDDEAFARQWIVERARRGLSAAALRDELRAKGIDREGVEAALQAAGLDDHAQAAATAARQVKRVAHLPLPTQAARLQGALLRRGFAADVAEEAVRAVLPPEGWD